MLHVSGESEVAAWSPEWTASAILLATTAIYVRGWLRGERNHARLGTFLGGIALLAIAIASPLEAFDDSFLSAHLTQHFLLMMAAPPLLLPLARPNSRAQLHPRRRSCGSRRAVASALLQLSVAWRIAKYGSRQMVEYSAITR